MVQVSGVPSSVKSLSARRAWIEINTGAYRVITPIVALRKESVDRNLTFSFRFRSSVVALRKESVDRNADASKISKLVFGRSPQGERG